jgi:hypothetical protein
MIIGITGAAQCGKDTLARAIRIGRCTYPHYRTSDGEFMEPASGGDVVTVTAFATALRDVVEAAFGCRYETAEEKAQVDTWWEERIGDQGPVHARGREMLGDVPVTGRRILQFIGTDLFREFVHPNFWLFAMERRLSMSKAVHHVISDVRFDNEAKWVQDQGGFVVHLTRASPVPAGPGFGGLTATEQAHASEAGVSHRYIDEWHTCRSTVEVEELGIQLAIRLLDARSGVTEEGE